MKTKFYFVAALAATMLASCADDKFVGDNSPNVVQNENAENAINFAFNLQNITRAGELTGATAAEKLGGMFVVEGTKGKEEDNSPSTDVVFDNYLVGYEYNHAGKTESDTHNWEYVGKQVGITSSTIGSASASDRMTGATWTALHNGATDAKSQTIKYWDYSVSQYDFIAWSTGNREAVTTAAEAGKVKVTRINTGTTLSSTGTGQGGFTMSAYNADDLLECYYTDITTVVKGTSPDFNFGKPVTLKFKNMAAKVRVALYETVPGYSVKDVQFYTSDEKPTTPDDLAYDKGTDATLFTMGDNWLPRSGDVLVYYPHIGKGHRDASGGQTKDYNKASVIVTPGSNKLKTQAFGTLSNFAAAESNEADDSYLGRSITAVTYAGVAAKDYYTAVIPNTNGYPLTLRLNYTLVATDGSGEEIMVYGAKAVVPATYTVWQPNYAYTYIFKISDNTNGWTSKTYTDPNGLFPITFDAVVTSFTDTNAEQTTVTTVATPSITTYQQGHDVVAPDPAHNEYSKSQKAGVSDDVKDVYVQVMDNSGTTPSLVADLDNNNSLLFAVTKTGATPISEASVMDALQNRTNAPTGTPEAASYKNASPEGRNGIILTKDANISNIETTIVNGVDDQPITKIAGVNITSGQVAKIDIDKLTTGTYAYVYCSTVPSSEKKVYNVVSISTNEEAKNYYEINPSKDMSTTACTAGTKAVDGYVYFVRNVDAKGAFVSWTFKQTNIDDDVEGLYMATIPTNKANTYTSGHFYFDVYYQNNGKYAVKVIKVVD